MRRMGRRILPQASSNCERPGFKVETPILVVQRNAFLARSLGRYLAAHYATVHVTASPSEAERYLAAEPNAPWRLVCGQAFGADEPDGISAIAAWRARYPGIFRAILATGAGISGPCPVGVDGLFEKPGAPADLLELLSLDCNTKNPIVPLERNHEYPMKNTTPKLHDLKTLKERVSAQTNTKSSTAQVSTARGFTSI